jgi:threonine dehydrogenase-like Zn-dependent dehydrogenase
MASQSMKVLQIIAPLQMQMVEMAVPEPQGRQVRVKRSAIVTCNAYDLHIWTGKPYPDETSKVDFPYALGMPGHEWIAVVDKVGPEVSLLKVGDWVCGPGGRGEEGPHPGGPGGYAPYSVIHETRLIKVPPKADPARLAPFEMAACVAATMIDLNAMDAIRGKRTAVIGLGPAGIIAAQMLRADGAAQVVGLDVDSRRRDYALAKGIVDKAINPIGEDGKGLPYRRRGDANALIETGVDCAGAPAAISYLMDHTRDIVSLFAVQHGAVEFRGWSLGHHQGLKLHGYPGRDYECGEYTLRQVAGDKIDLSLTVSHTMRLEEYPQALALIQSQQALKVMFTFDERDW